MDKQRGRVGEGRGERGVVSAEFVVVMPILLFFLFLTADLGWMLKNWLVVTNAARESARCAIASSCAYDGDEVDPLTLAQARIWNGGLPWDKDGEGGRWPLADEPTIDLHWVDHNGSGTLNEGDSVVVCIEVQSNYITPVIPFLGFVTGGAILPDPMPIRAREEMLIEFAGGLNPADYTQLPEDKPCNF